MNGGDGTVGLDSIESCFHDPKTVKQIEAEVRSYEERVQGMARALDQKHPLEEKINELNTRPKNSKKMTTSNNLNQLLSRMKTIFGHKTHHEEKTTESQKQHPVILDQRLQTALSEIEKHLADNYGTTPSAFSYKEYTNGVSIESKDPTFSTAVATLTSTGGMLNLPDNVLLLCYVTTDKDNNFLIEHLGNFIRFLMKLGRTHQIQHFAIAFSKDTDNLPNAVKTADVTCICLYQPPFIPLAPIRRRILIGAKTL